MDTIHKSGIVAHLRWQWTKEMADALLVLYIDFKVANHYNASTGVAQVTRTSAQTLTIISDKKTWTLSVRAMTSTFSFTPSLGDPNPNKPASDLAVRNAATSGTFVVLTTSDQVLSTGPKSASAQTVNLDYRLNSNLSTNPPGNYTISIIYTLTNP